MKCSRCVNQLLKKNSETFCGCPSSLILSVSSGQSLKMSLSGPADWVFPIFLLDVQINLFSLLLSCSIRIRWPSPLRQPAPRTSIQMCHAHLLFYFCSFSLTVCSDALFCITIILIFINPLSQGTFFVYHFGFSEVSRQFLSDDFRSVRYGIYHLS